MRDRIAVRIGEVERGLLDRQAEREGVAVSVIVRRALLQEIEGGPAVRIIDPRLATDLLNAAANMGRRSEELVAALLRDHLKGLTEEDVDPRLRKARARARARELLGA